MAILRWPTSLQCSLGIVPSGYSIGGVLLEIKFYFLQEAGNFEIFSRMMSGCRNSLFNMKNYTPETPMERIEICLIHSASNNYTGLDIFISSFCPSIVIFVTILFKSNSFE